MVDRNKLKNATSKARTKSDKEGYCYLTYRPPEVIFQNEKLANWRGQGIGKSKLSGDTWPPLDSTKVRDLKVSLMAQLQVGKTRLEFQRQWVGSLHQSRDTSKTQERFRI